MQNKPYATFRVNLAVCAVLLSVLYLALTLTACGQPDNQVPTRKTKANPTETQPGVASLDDPTPSPIPKPTEEPTSTPEMISQIDVDPDELRGLALTFWHIWSGETEVVLDEIIEEFNTQNEWGIQVQAVNQGNLDLIDEKVLAEIQEDNLPDLTMGYLYQALVWDSEHGLVDLDDYVKDPIWGLLEEDQADFLPIFWEHDYDGERRVGIPIYRSGQMLYYNVSRAFELGFTAAPTTLEAFEQQACEAAQIFLEDEDPDNNGAGGWIISTDYPSVMGWLHASGAQIVTSNQGKTGGGYDFDNRQVQDTFTFLRELYDQGCAWITENQYPDEEFANRLGLFAAGSLSGLTYQDNAIKQAGSNDQWTMIPFPSSGSEPAISVYGPSLEVFSSSDNRQLAAWLFIKWLISTENLTKLTESTSSFPLRASSLEQLTTGGNLLPQWGAAVRLLPLAHPEPAYQSWSIVRWAVSDAATQLFRSYFTIEGVPELVTFLDKTANELHEDPLKDSRAISATPTPKGTSTPTEVRPTPSDAELLTPTP